jgi:TolB-like protein
VGIAYAVASWVLLQIVDVISPIFELPAWAPKLIFVILAIGLVPALIFAWVFEMTPEGLKKESEVDRSASIVSATGHRLNYVITGFLVIAVALLLVERQLKPVVVEEPGSVVAEVASEEAQIGKSIAVLPFVNMSSDAEQEFFSDGITEEILNSLASVQELKVAGRTSSFAFKGQNDDLRRIGEALGVNHILEGSVRKAGAQVRITAQLIQVDNGFHLWSETYDRELTDVFAIQDEIANEILKQLRSKLLTDEVVVAEAKRTNPEVYELYLQAKQRIYTRIRPEIETAVDELDQAIQMDQEYAPAFAQRGIATMLLSDQQYGSIPNDEADRRAKRYIDQALQLDPNLAEGWAALGLYFDPQDTDGAIDALAKALAINPNLIDAGNWLQIALRNEGDLLSSMEIIEDIVERDPLYRPAFSNAMAMFNNFGRQDKADALLKRIEAFNPDNPDLLLARATNLLYSGRYGEGLKIMEERRKLGNMSGVARIYLSIGLMGTGQFERATTEGSPYWRPDALYATGKIEDAFELAHDQAKGGDPGNLFYLLLRANRDQELVDYLEERWPSLSAFASENPGSDVGWEIMEGVAIAYSTTGNAARFDEAMQFVESRLDSLADQGISNAWFSLNRATHAALLGDVETTFAHLEAAVDGGWVAVGEPADIQPALRALVDEPRYAELKARMLVSINADRHLLDLPPLDENYEVQL